MATATPKFLVTSLEDSKYNDYICDKIQEIANEAISSRGVFLLGVSGGSVIKYLSEGLPQITTDWKSWRIFLCDERLVAEDDPESTFGLYKKNLLTKLPDFPLENFLAANTSLPCAESAKDYETRLRSFWSMEVSSPSYGMSDCLVLGVGPDGHTCSLFPGHSVLQVTDSWVTSIEDSPKPPPRRITLTYPFINKASIILIAGKGKEKWDILEKVQDGEDLPISRVDNPGGHLEWVLDSI